MDEQLKLNYWKVLGISICAVFALGHMAYARSGGDGRESGLEEGLSASSPKGASHYLGVDRPQNMLRLVLKLTDQGIEVQSRVEAPNTMNRRSPHEKRSTFYRIFNSEGQVLLERGFRLETEVRSESNGVEGTIEGHHIDIAEPTFSIAIPLYDDMDVVRFYKVPGEGFSRADADLLGEVRP